MQIVPSLWDLYLLMPMIPGNADRTVNALIVGTLTLLGGVVLYVVSESQVRLKLGGVVDPAPKKVGSG